MQISWLPKPEDHPLWTEVCRLLQPAADLGGIDVYEGRDWVWLIYEGETLHAAATTRLWDDGEAELRLAAGHRLPEWVGLLNDTVTQWARDGGAHRLTMRGRKGWARFARAFGWVALGFDDAGRALFEKEL